MNRRQSGGRATAEVRTETAPLVTLLYSEHQTFLRQKTSAERTLSAYQTYLSDREQRRPRNGQVAKWVPLLAWCRRNRIVTCSDLTRDVIDRYLDEQRALSTQNTYRRIADFTKRLMRYAADEGYVEPFYRKIALPKEAVSAIAVFSDEDVVRMSKVVSKEHPRDWAIFLTLVCTGLRCNELVNLNVDDVKWDVKELVVRREVSKNKRQRNIPMSDAYAALKKYWETRRNFQAKGSPFFLGFNGSPVSASRGAPRTVKLDVHKYGDWRLTKSCLSHLIRKWGKLAGITDARCSPHTFRHYFAISFLRRGGDLLSLKTWLGHSKFEMTERYAALATTDLHAAARKVNLGAPFMSIRTPAILNDSK